MNHTPSIKRCWQYDDDAAPPLTCYDERNPAMPWLPAAIAHDEADQAEVREWLRTGIHAEEIQTKTPTPRQSKERLALQIDADPSALHLTVLEQLERAITQPHKP